MYIKGEGIHVCVKVSYIWLTFWTIENVQGKEVTWLWTYCVRAAFTFQFQLQDGSSGAPGTPTLTDGGLNQKVKE